VGARFALVLGFVPLVSSRGAVPSSRKELLAPSAVALYQSRRSGLSATLPAWTLRLCNAFSFDDAVDIFHVQKGRRSGLSYTNSSSDDSKHEEMLTEASGPLAYKRCIDVEGVHLVRGSIIAYRIDADMQIGTFMVNQLPAPGSMLQLVLKRLDTWSTAADFSSHIFTDAPTPQVALVDCYLGKSKSTLEVRDLEEFSHETAGKKLLGKQGKRPQRRQHVDFGRVVEINAGEYEWLLFDSRQTQKASVEFKATGRTKYTVLRVGAEAIAGESLPEELTVFPAEGAIVLRGAEDQRYTEKGLFGIPSDFWKGRRSGAECKSLSVVWALLVFCGALASDM
jgi:hypothetical protein